MSVLYYSPLDGIKTPVFTICTNPIMSTALVEKFNLANADDLIPQLIRIIFATNSTMAKTMKENVYYLNNDYEIEWIHSRFSIDSTKKELRRDEKTIIEFQELNYEVIVEEMFTAFYGKCTIIKTNLTRFLPSTEIQMRIRAKNPDLISVAVYLTADYDNLALYHRYMYISFLSSTYVGTLKIYAIF